MLLWPFNVFSNISTSLPNPESHTGSTYLITPGWPLNMIAIDVAMAFQRFFNVCHRIVRNDRSNWVSWLWFETEWKVTLLVLVFSIVVGEIEDCVFGGLKLGTASIKHSILWSMRHGDRSVSSVAGMEAAFSTCETAIGKGSTPVLVGGIIVSYILGFILFLNVFRGRLGEGLVMVG